MRFSLWGLFAPLILSMPQLMPPAVPNFREPLQARSSRRSHARSSRDGSKLARRFRRKRELGLFGSF
jgi:hypothetical protein